MNGLETKNQTYRSKINPITSPHRIPDARISADRAGTGGIGKLFGGVEVRNNSKIPATIAQSIQIGMSYAVVA